MVAVKQGMRFHSDDKSQLKTMAVTPRKGREDEGESAGQ